MMMIMNSLGTLNQFLNNNRSHELSQKKSLFQTLEKAIIYYFFSRVKI